jgi:lipoprotein NlpD
MGKWILLFFMLGLLSCGSRDTLAPVVESHWSPFNVSKHIVKKGETLYAIAFKYDADYRQLAKSNNLRSPYTLSVGQVINLRSSRSKSHQLNSTPKQVKRTFKHGRYRKNHWLWPAKGRIVSYFSPKRGQKGINIAGKKGDKIYASTSGVVAYSGRGLANYGNLIIIKHDNYYLTAYGNNSRNLVSEGDRVKAGQVIAEMGVIGRKYYGVHFEIRKRGQPVNPTSYL